MTNLASALQGLEGPQLITCRQAWLEGCMAKVSPEGVLVGGILGVGATYALAIPAMVLAPESLSYGVGLVVASACAILAGNIAARIAKHDERLNGALSAWLSMLLQTYNWATGESTETALAHVGYLVLTPALGGLGGYLLDRTKRKLPAAPPPPESLGRSGGGASALSRFVIAWAASGLILSLLGRLLFDLLWIGALAFDLVWVLVGLAFWILRTSQARDLSRRSQSLRDRRFLMACGVGVVVLWGPLHDLGSRLLVDYRFKSFRPTYESIIASLPDSAVHVRRLTGPMGEYFVDPGPPVRVAFVLPPGRFIDNWCGAVYDPTGEVMQANQFDGNWNSWHVQVPPRIIELFGGDMLGCRPLHALYYHCCFT